MRHSAKLFAGLTLLAAVSSLAAGDPHTQGTMLAGQGLDWQRSGTLLQPQQEVKPAVPSDAVPYPPPQTAAAGQNLAPPKSFAINRASLEFTKCEPISDVVMRCEVSAKPGTAPGPDSQLCGHWLGDRPTVWVYLINGRPNDQGMFSFDSTGNAGSFVACSVAKPKEPDAWEWRSLGAVGKCLLWQRDNGMGWIPEKKTPLSLDAFNACLRAVRADYCGTGVTHTVDGTHIELYGVKDKHEVKLPYLLEATWNERGALCIIHARWRALSPGCKDQFSHVLGQPPPPKKKGDEKLGKSGTNVPPPYGNKGGTGEDSFTGSEYHCDPNKVSILAKSNSCDAEQQLMGQALRFGILADDSMLQ